MNFRQRITVYILLYFALCSTAFAQVVEISDLNLRNAVREALNLPAGTSITQADMRQLHSLDVTETNLTKLTGLEHAVHLSELKVGHNPLLSDLTSIAKLVELNYLDAGRCNISDITALADLKNLNFLQLNRNYITDLTPLANLTQLTALRVEDNRITDLTPLANLTQLSRLEAQNNQIADITPLANLTQLTILYLTRNRVADVSPLASLQALERLEIERNVITDHSLLDALSLTHFVYDQFCEMPPLPLEPRLANRTYPSTFGGEWLFGLDFRIDLTYGGGYLGMRFRPDGKLTGNLDYAIQKRDELLAFNPNMVFLVQIRMRTDGISHYGENWPYWVRDEHGNIILRGGTENALVDFTHPAVQDLIVEQAIAVSKCGLFDGILFDVWHEDITILRDDRSGRDGYRGLDAEQRARDNILRRIRAETRPNFLIQVNSNRSKLLRTGPFINGLSMETGIPAWYPTDDELENALLTTESTLLWAEENLREPHINGAAGQGILTEPANSPFNRRWMRVVTTLSLTHADGYALYQREWGGWYDFLETDLGHPVGGTAQLYDEDIPGLFIREFTNGWALYNRSGEAQEITLPELATGVESGVEDTTHILPNYDGEMYLKAKPKNPADVNGDGVVNIFDLTIVAQRFGTDSLEGDVNGDGVVNVFDLVFVANQF